jgi:hypothetical protein
MSNGFVMAEANISIRIQHNSGSQVLMNSLLRAAPAKISAYSVCLGFDAGVGVTTDIVACAHQQARSYICPQVDSY